MNKFLLVVATIFPIVVVLLGRVLYPTLDLVYLTFVWWIVSPAYAFLSIWAAYRFGQEDECYQFDPDVLEAILHDEEEHAASRSTTTITIDGIIEN